MGKQNSFDISTGCDLQEVDNAVNQANKELQQRFDFRNVEFTVEFKRQEKYISISAPDEYKMNAIWDVVSSKLIRRKVPLKNFERGEMDAAAGTTRRQRINLKMAIDSDTAKKIVKFIKEKKLKKVQASIQGEEVRVTSPSRDLLQQTMGVLKNEDFGVELIFGNYR